MDGCDEQRDGGTAPTGWAGRRRWIAQRSSAAKAVDEMSSIGIESRGQQQQQRTVWLGFTVVWTVCEKAQLGEQA